MNFLHSKLNYVEPEVLAVLGPPQAQPNAAPTDQQQYGADRVCLCRLVKPYNFLHWEFCGHEPEAYHLLHFTEAQRKSTEDYVAQLYNGGLSLRQIATQTGNSLSTVHRLVKRLDEYD